MAFSDFNNDGFGDLAIGVARDAIGGLDQAGRVAVLGGSPNGLTALRNQSCPQSSAGVLGSAFIAEMFGQSLAGGDFNGDGFDDLAIGTPGETLPSVSLGGQHASVNVLYGSTSGLTATSDQAWNEASAGVIGLPEGRDAFSGVLATGVSNNDGFDDLAVGVPDESIGTDAKGGAVQILYGSATGLTAAGDHMWHQASLGIRETAEENDGFGSALTVVDFNNDWFDDLAIGVPGEDPGLFNVIQFSGQRRGCG